MLKLSAFLLLSIITTICHADVITYYVTGQDLYVRFDDASNTAVDMVEGSGLKTGRYVAPDAGVGGIAASTLPPGNFSARVFIGTAGTQASGDVEVTIVPEYKFDGTAQITGVTAD